MAAQSTVLINGVAASTEFVSTTQLKGTFNAPVTAGNTSVRVRTPDPLNSGTYLTSNELILATSAPTLTLSPSSVAIVKGSTADVTVRLPFIAPNGGIAVNLSTTAAGVVNVPATVVVPEGQDNVTFTVSSVDLGAVELIASRLGATSARTQLNVTKPLVLTVSPATFNVGTGRTATLTVQSSVSLGATVELSSSAPSVVTVPTSVIIPAGNLAATVQLTGVAEGTATITAKSTNYASASASVTVHQTRLGLPSGIVATPGMAVPVTLSLTDPAPSGGLLVSLASANASVATVPASITVPAGQTSASFVVTGVTSGTSLITATANGYQSASMQTTVDTVSVQLGSPVVNSIALQVGSGQTFPITLSRGAPTGGLTMTLSMNDPGKATVAPATLSFSEGATWGGTIVVNGIAKGTTNLSVNAGAAGTLNIPVVVTSMPELVSMPTTITIGKGFNTAPQEVSIGRKLDGVDYAPNQALTVSLVSNDPSKVTVPDSVTIPAGQSTASFIVTGLDLTSESPVTINASAAGYGNAGAIYAVSVVSPQITILGIETARTVGGARDEFSVKVGTPGSAYADTQTAAVDLPVALNLVEMDPSGIVDGFYESAGGDGTNIDQLALRKGNAANGVAFVGQPTSAGRYKVQASLGEMSVTTSDAVTVASVITEYALRFSTTNATVDYGRSATFSVVRLQNGIPFADAIPLDITLTSSDQTKVGLYSSVVTIPAGSSSVDFELGGWGVTSQSSVYVDASAEGYASPVEKLMVSVTSAAAELQFSHGGGYGLGKGQKMTVSVYRQNYDGNNAQGDLSVSLVASSAGKVNIPATVTIPDGSYSASFDVIGIDNPDNTLVSIDAIASDYRSPSQKLEVMVGTPELRFSYAKLGVRPSSEGTGFIYRTVNGYPSMPSEEVVVNLSSADSARVSVAASTTIPVGGYSSTFTVTGLQDTAADGVAISASAPNHVAQGSMSVVVGNPQFSFNTDRTAVAVGMQTNGFVQLTIHGASYQAPEDIQVNLISSNPSKFTVPTPVTIGKGGNFADFTLTGVEGTGGAVETLDATATGDYGSTMKQSVVVGRPMLRFDNETINIRKGGKAQVVVRHFIENAESDSFCRSEEAIVTLTSSNSAKVAVPTQVTIPQCGDGVAFDLEGIDDTGDEIVTIDAVSSGYLSPAIKPSVKVGALVYDLRFSYNGDGIGIGTGKKAYAYLYLADNTDGSGRYATEDVVVSLTSSELGKISYPESITIPTGNSYAWFEVSGLADTGDNPVALRATSKGYGPASMNAFVGTPEIRFLQSTLGVGKGLQAMTMLYRFVKDRLFPATENLTLSLTSDSPGKAAVPATVEMVNFNAYGVPVTGGQLTDGTPAIVSVAPPPGYTVKGTMSVNVVTPQLSVTAPSEVPVGSSRNFDVSVSGPGPNYIGEQTVVAPTTVNLSNSAPSVITAPSSVVIPAGAPRISASLNGVTPGDATLTATSAGFQTGASAPITVKP